MGPRSVRKYGGNVDFLREQILFIRIEARNFKWAKYHEILMLVVEFTGTKLKSLKEINLQRC